MITSFEVGSVFQIVDKATPVLARLSREMSEFAKLVKDTKKELASLGTGKPFAGLDRNLKAATDQLAKLTKDSEAAGRAMATGADAAAVSVRSLTAAWQQAAAAARSASVAGGGSGGVRNPRQRVGGSHSGGGGISTHVSNVRAPFPGGHIGIGGSDLALGAIGALGFGVWNEAQLEDIAARSILTGQIRVDSGMTNTAAFKRLREIIQRNSSLGGFDPKEVGEAILGSERQFAGLPFEKRMSILDILLPFAEQESRFKETGLKESAEAFIGLAHMTGTYDPAKLPDLYRKFAFASMITPASLPQFQNALSYAMPSLVGGMGMNPDAVLFLTAMNQAAGIRSTKAGTWIQSFFSKLMPYKGANLKDSEIEHNDALRGLGLIDSSNNPTWMVRGQNGKTDWLQSLVKLSPLLGDKFAALPETQRLHTLEGIFGKQGGREAGLMNLPEFVAQFPKLAQMLRNNPGGEDFLKQLDAASPIQKMREAFSDLKNVLTDIGSVVLPQVTQGLKVLDEHMKLLGSILPTQSLAPAKGGWLEWLGKLATSLSLGGTGLGSVIKELLPGVHDGAKQGTAEGSEIGVIKGFAGVRDLLNGGGGGLVPTSFTVGSGSAPRGLHSGGGYRVIGGGSGIGSLATNLPSGSPSSGDPRGMLAAITASAIANGIDPSVAITVARAEGLASFIGDHGTSFGAFQLHRGGRGSVGTEFERETGLNLADPRNERATIDYALKWVRKHGWAAWMGARARGIYGFRGVHRDMPDISIPQDKKSEIHINVPVNLDGRKISQNVMKHIVSAGNAPAGGARLPDYMGTRPISV